MSTIPLFTITISVSAPLGAIESTAPGEIKLGQVAAGMQSLSAAAQKARDAMGKMNQTAAEKLSDAITGAAPGELIPAGKVAPKRGRKPRTSPVAKPAKAKPAKRKARAPKSDNAAKVVDAITRGADKFADLLASTGIKRATLRAVLGRLKKDGKIFGAGKKFEMVYGRTQAEADKRFEAKKAK